MNSTPAKVNIDGGSWINGLQLFNIMQTSTQTNAINQQTKDLRHAYDNVQRTLSDISNVQYELTEVLPNIRTVFGFIYAAKFLVVIDP